MGEVDLFNQLFRQYYQPLLFFALQYITDEEECHDIVNGVFEKAWQHIHQIDESTAKSFLFTSVRNRCIDYVRRMDHQIPDTDNLLGETGVDLGVTHKENAMNVDSAGTNVAFVQNETVYEYNKKKNALVKIFGFAEEQTGSS